MSDIAKLRSFRNGIHGHFFMKIADEIEALKKEREDLQLRAEKAEARERHVVSTFSDALKKAEVDANMLGRELAKVVKEKKALKAKVKELTEDCEVYKRGSTYAGYRVGKDRADKAEAERDRLREDYRTAIKDGLVTAGVLEEVMKERDRLRESNTVMEKMLCRVGAVAGVKDGDVIGVIEWLDMVEMALALNHKDK